MVTETRPLKDLLGQVDLNNFVSLIPALTNYFTSRADSWKLTSFDQEILAMVQGQHIEFQLIPFQKEPPVQFI